MPAVRVTVVSDSHLSERTPEAASNWDAVVDHVAATTPDLVVHAGDISADGASRPADLEVAAADVDRLPAPTVVVPGNHDVGVAPALSGSEPPLDDARLDRFRDVFGADRFSARVGRWRIVGVDAQLFGAGTRVEDEQWDWLAAQLDGRAPLVFVLHKPLVPADGDVERPYRYVPAAARQRLLALLDASRPAVVVSGHVHQRLRHERAGATHVWAPTTWAVLPDDLQAPVGEKVCGVVELTLHDDGRADVAEVVPPGLRNHMLGVDAVDPYSAGGSAVR
jgi:3',5'-cyclic AMP phosphodiesterase CpdA